MDFFDPFLESRRFSGLILSHVDWTTQDKALEAATTVPRIEASRHIEIADWIGRRVSYVASKNYFPKHMVADDVVASGDGFIQELYVAASSLVRDGVEEPCLLIWAPYVRLMNSFLRDLTRHVGRPTPAYAIPRMQHLFQHFHDKSYPAMHVTRISVVDFGEPSVELVSLSGRQPLRSSLRLALKDTLPYAVRIELTSGEAAATNLHMDRYGNFWWYQRAESSAERVLNLLTVLSSEGLFSSTREIPTKRTSDDG